MPGCQYAVPIRKTWLCSANLLHEAVSHQSLVFIWENHYLVTAGALGHSAHDCAARRWWLWARGLGTGPGVTPCQEAGVEEENPCPWTAPAPGTGGGEMQRQLTASGCSFSWINLALELWERLIFDPRSKGWWKKIWKPQSKGAATHQLTEHWQPFPGSPRVLPEGSSHAP